MVVTMLVAVMQLQVTEWNSIEVATPCQSATLDSVAKDGPLHHSGGR